MLSRLQFRCGLRRLPVLLRALEAEGIERADLESTTTRWIHTTEEPGGMPAEFSCAIDLPGAGSPTLLELSVDGEAPDREAPRRLVRGPGGLVPMPPPDPDAELRLIVEPPDEPAGRRALERWITRFRKEVRRDHGSPMEFLGERQPPKWRVRYRSAVDLPFVEDAIRTALADWTLVQTLSPTVDDPEIETCRGWSGEWISFLAAARFFYEQGPDRRLVVEFTTAGPGAIAVRVAAHGMSAQELEQVESRIAATIDEATLTSTPTMRPDGEWLDLGREFSWDDLQIDTEIETLVRSEIEGFFDRKELFDSLGVAHQRGLLIHGPPGTGKTLLGKVIASQLQDVAFIWVTAADVRDPTSVRNLFRLARRFEKCVLFFEDLDLVASDRGDPSNGERGRLGELLVQLDGMERNRGLLVLGTTNDLGAIEPAIKNRPSRFDRLIEFGPAGPRVRQTHLLRLLAKRHFDPKALLSIVPATEGFTGAQLQELAGLALRKAAWRGSDKIEREDFVAALEGAAGYRSEVSAGFQPAGVKSTYEVPWEE